MTHPILPEIETLVVGAGVLGTCAAGFLAEDGAEVALIGDGRIGGSNANAGSLHVQMQSRFMRLYPDQVSGLESTLHLYPKAVAFWQDLQRKLGADFDLKMTGGLMIAESEDQLAFLADKVKRERQLGLDSQILDRSDLHRIAPYLGSSVVGAELCRNEGKLNPLHCNTAIRAWVAALAVPLIEDEEVLSLRRDGARYVAATARGEIACHRLVLAAASGTRRLAACLGVAIPAEPEPLHMNITEATEPLIGHLVQHADRPITLKQFGTGQIVIGGGWPARLAGQRRDPTVEIASLIGNTTLAQHIVPAIAPLRVIRTWAGVNTTVDGRGVLGEVPGMPGLFIAIPGDAGYTLGPLSAWLVAEIMGGRDPGEDMSIVSPGRFGGSLSPGARA